MIWWTNHNEQVGQLSEVMVPMRRKMLVLLAALSLWAAFFAASACLRVSDQDVRSILDDDRLCEIWVTQQMHQLTDMWRQRYGLVVWCQATEASARALKRQWTGQGQIAVTVTLANGEDQPLPDQATSAASLLRGQLEAAVLFGGLTDRYPER